LWYGFLGVAAAMVSITFTDSLLALRAWFRRLKRVPRWVQPGIGGAAAGALAVVGLAF
jgi:H+/Cl- antiporter ClcA